MEKLSSYFSVLGAKGVLPFVMLTAGMSGKSLGINKGRLAEALIIAVVTAMCSGYVSVRVLEVKLDSIIAIQKIQEDQSKQAKNELREDIKTVQLNLSQHIQRDIK